MFIIEAKLGQNHLVVSRIKYDYLQPSQDLENVYPDTVFFFLFPYDVYGSASIEPIAAKCILPNLAKLENNDNACINQP